MKILIASTSVPGHLNPLLAVANILMKHNHEVVMQTAPSLRPMVEAAGVTFIPTLSVGGGDIGQFLTEFPERQQQTPGLEMFCFDMKYFFARHIPAQAAGLELTLRDFPADIILADSFFFGTLPMLLDAPETRPSIVHLGITVLNLGSGRNVPPRPGASLEEQHAEHEKRELLLLKPVQAAFNAILADMGCGPLPCSATEVMSNLPDLYLHPGVQSFEYPEESPSSSPVRYIGPLPLPPGQASLPDWWHELDQTKRLVLVTQGTVANHDLGQLVGPALTGLANEKDLIVLITTGGKPTESIPVEIPANARVANFLPYELIMPKVDLLITNGGYGTVNMALAHGIPIISAGLTEDKEEVSAHVQWAGAGIDLRTNQATPETVHAAARKILDTPGYRNQAKKLAQEFASHDTEKELLTKIEACLELRSSLLLAR
jgi:UDP:flavonoid glycosyltransferase YjiC (YdhE family)